MCLRVSSVECLGNSLHVITAGILEGPSTQHQGLSWPHTMHTVLLVEEQMYPKKKTDLKS